MSDALQATVTVTVPFHDVDPAGVVWHGHYFRYFELARCEVLEKLDYSYAQMAESGYIWPLVDLSCRFTRPIRYNDVIEVEARLTGWIYRLEFEYRVFSPDGEELAKARTVQVPVEAESGEMMIGVPDILERRIEAIREGQ